MVSSSDRVKLEDFLDGAEALLAWKTTVQAFQTGQIDYKPLELLQVLRLMAHQLPSMDLSKQLSKLRPLAVKLSMSDST